jgi:hypothetical protein
LTDLLSAYPPAIWVALLAAGALIGLLAGLLGVGGRVVAVPVLIEIFDAMGLDLVRAWLPPLLAGAGLVARWRDLGERPDQPVRSHCRGPCLQSPVQMPPAIVGARAAAVGVGGGTLSTPVLSLFSFPITRALGAGALFNLAIFLPATALFVINDLDTPGRTVDALGDVLRGGAVAACALCRARGGALVGARAGLGAAPVVRIRPRRDRGPTAVAGLN